MGGFFAMAKTANQIKTHFIDAETGTIRKGLKGRIRVAIVYANLYSVGMSNLGFQTAYRLFNQADHVVCERAFLPEPGNYRVKTIESGRSLNAFHIIAFSISFENDAPGILSILEKTGLPLAASKRGAPLPLILAGGVSCFLNPEPIAPFIDCFLLGEAEVLIPLFLDCFDPTISRQACLEHLAKNIPGAYVPSLYSPEYHKDGTLKEFRSEKGIPKTIKRVFAEDLSSIPTESTILTPHTTFDDTFLIEVSRGCPHGCRFCSAGYVYRPPRFRPIPLLEKQIDQGARRTDKIGLVGAAVSDLPGISRLCTREGNDRLRFSFSSLRADAMETELMEALKKSRIKTATIAPDAGSERMRKVINKGLTQDHILTAAERLVQSGIPNLKLYFMVGLPFETDDDVQEIVRLCQKIKTVFLAASRAKKRIGTISVSLNPFVPKPFTPFQWAAMDDVKTMKRKIKQVAKGLGKIANVSVQSDSPKNAYIQAFLSRGDRRVADLLMSLLKNKGNWPQTLRASPLETDFYVLRERPADEHFPWDFIDHGIDKSFLLKEYQMAKSSKTSPPCPARPDKCDLCGVCNGNAIKHQSR